MNAYGVNGGLIGPHGFLFSGLPSKNKASLYLIAAISQFREMGRCGARQSGKHVDVLSLPRLTWVFHRHFTFLADFNGRVYHGLGFFLLLFPFFRRCR